MARDGQTLPCFFGRELLTGTQPRCFVYTLSQAAVRSMKLQQRPHTFKSSKAQEPCHCSNVPASTLAACLRVSWKVIHRHFTFSSVAYSSIFKSVGQLNVLSICKSIGHVNALKGILITLKEHCQYSLNERTRKQTQDQPLYLSSLCSSANSDAGAHARSHATSYILHPCPP